MRPRSIWLIAAAFALLMPAVQARADLSLFGAYYNNVAREAARNDPMAVRKSLGEGHAVDEEDDQGRTGLLIAAINGNLQIAAILIKSGAHLDSRDKFGNTPLHYAVERNHVDMAQLLLDAGAPPDIENRNGMTPLMLAASRGHVELVEALLAKGASVRKSDYTGRDALGWAEDSHRPQILQMLRRAEAR